MIDRRLIGCVSVLLLAGCPDDEGGDTSTSFGGTTMQMMSSSGAMDSGPDDSTTTGEPDDDDDGTSTTTGEPPMETSSSTGGGSCSVDMHESNDDDMSATMVDIGDTINGIMCNGDVDWFTFNNDALGNVAIDLTFMVGEGDLDVYLLDASLAEVANSAGGSGLEAIHIELDVGRYYVRVELGTPQGTTMDANYTLAFSSF